MKGAGMLVGNLELSNEMSKVSINVFGHQRRGFEAIHVSIFKVNFKTS